MSNIKLSKDGDHASTEQLSAPHTTPHGGHGVADYPPSLVPPPEDALWWLPNAVLGALVLVGLLGFFGVFNDLLRPLAAKPAAGSSHGAEVSATSGH
jgi:hypothetical protein